MTGKSDEKDEKNPSGMPKKSSTGLKIVSSYRSGWAYSEYAFQYALAIVACTLIGYWLDNLLNTGHVLLIIGVLLGSVAGFIGLLKSLNVLNTKKEIKKKDPGNHGNV